MSDLTGQTGFEIPSYDDLTKKLAESGDNRLEKVAQVLGTAQMTHMTLSNFKAYKSFVDDLGTSVFDPLTNSLKAGAGGLLDGGINSAGGGLIPGEILKMASNPSQLYKQGRTLISTLQDKNTLTSKLSGMGEQLKRGEIPEDLGQIMDKENADKLTQLATKGKGLYQSAMEGQLPGTEILPEELRAQLPDLPQLTGKAKLSGQLFNDIQGTIKEQLNSVPSATINQLKELGYSPEALQGKVSAGIDINKLLDQAKGATSFTDIMTNNDFSAEQLGKSYRLGKYLDKLNVNPQESGLLRGDSVLGRLGNGLKSLDEAKAAVGGELSKTINGNPITQTVKALSDTEGRDILSGAAKARGMAQEAIARVRARVSQLETVGQDTIQQAQQTIQNAKGELTQQVLNTINPAENADINEAGKLLTQDGRTAVESGIAKAKDTLSKLTEDTVDLDETPVGDILNGILGVATIGTLIAGLFEKPKPEPLAVPGDQIGV